MVCVASRYRNMIRDPREDIERNGGIHRRVCRTNGKAEAREFVRPFESRKLRAAEMDRRSDACVARYGLAKRLGKVLNVKPVPALSPAAAKP